MIRYKLACGAGHAFDCWFRSSSDFEGQAAGRLLACPACGSTDVGKALMAPAVSTGAAAADAPPRPDAPEPDAREPDAPVALVDERQARLRQLLGEFRAELTRNSEDVGERFPEVARKMHDEEIERRTIHGRATAEEAEALLEDGVAIQLLPAFPNDMN